MGDSLGKRRMSHARRVTWMRWMTMEVGACFRVKLHSLSSQAFVAHSGARGSDHARTERGDLYRVADSTSGQAPRKGCEESAHVWHATSVKPRLTVFCFETYRRQEK